ncbi:MAG: indole-3-glycerol-phosphate synthase, partial [Actinomycetota bacterium]|nr:indole-3-glycerol-phosphate synthase [Actinomycetota bacterium]
MKRRSPSAGNLRPDADAAALAQAFERNGAAAVSVLVDERFGGSFRDLGAARGATRLPLLAKGFFRDHAALVGARDEGADAVLLLLRDLDDRRTAALLHDARILGLDALVEAHDAEELERAVALDADVVGVNARDLSTFLVDRRAQLELVTRAPRDRVIVAESGIESRAQAAAAEVAGADAVLVGSTLMRARDPGAKLAELRARVAGAHEGRADEDGVGARDLGGGALRTALDPALGDDHAVARRPRDELELLASVDPEGREVAGVHADDVRIEAARPLELLGVMRLDEGVEPEDPRVVQERRGPSIVEVAEQ